MTSDSSSLTAPDGVAADDSGAVPAKARANTSADPAGVKPAWLKVRAPGGAEYARLKQTLRKLDLYTVCEEARCPNVAECWSAGTATVMILGHTCTRGCRFCAVTTGNPRGAVDPREPEHVARALSELELKYAVLTMVDRDDLLDGGAEQMALTVSALKRRRPQMLVETLVGDFRGRRESIDLVLAAGPDVFAHNLEVTRALTPTIRDARCGYDRSLEVLRHAKRQAPQRLTKSSLMVGLGESDDEVLEAMRDLRGAQVDVVTLGQYLRPTPKHVQVERYVTPEQFAIYEREGRQMGFQFVASGPLVRSSYHAAEAFVAAAVRRAVPSELELAGALSSGSGSSGSGSSGSGSSGSGSSGSNGARPVVQPSRADASQLIHPRDLIRR